MKVVHLSSSDIGGGAALAAFRLHSGLRQRGIDSTMIVGRKFSSDPWVRRGASRLATALCERMDRQPRRFLRTTNQTHVSSAWVGSSAWRVANRERPDLAHLHWIGKGFLRLEDLVKIQAPLVWSLHDMWAFAGGEHYVDACSRYREGYRAGNRPPGESGWDLNRWVWERKRRAWTAMPQLTLFCVSQWLADRARESVLFRDRPIEVLHNALDPAVFTPGDQVSARAKLGLPRDRPLILFGALDATTDARKGFDLLTAALGALRSARVDLDLVVFGNEPGREDGGALALGFRTHYLGKISSDAKLATVYAACDVMIVPSREEAFGQTALEALACGTPVVAFRVGGLPEIIDHEFSGFLARPFDVQDLAQGISWVLSADDNRRRDLRAAGRATVERSFTLEVQSRRCVALYAEALERARPAYAGGERSAA